MEKRRLTAAPGLFTQVCSEAVSPSSRIKSARVHLHWATVATEATEGQTPAELLHIYRESCSADLPQH